MVVTKKGKQRVRKFIFAAQKHLQWLRMKNWELERDKNVVEQSKISYRIEEVTRDIDTAYKLISS